MFFLPFLDVTAGVDTLKIKMNMTEMPWNIEHSPGFAGNASRLTRNADAALAWPISQHGRAVPDIKNEKSAGIEMPAHRRECRHQVSIFKLIAENGKHHQHSLEALA